MRNRFRSGEPEALAQLHDENAQVLYRYALRVTGNGAEGEDVVSATFPAAWRGRAELRPDGDSLRPWLLGIATNIMRHDARSRRRRDIALARLPERGTVPDFADDVVGHVAETEQLRAAHAALSGLRRRDREVFMLVVWAGLEYTAAAEARHSGGHRTVPSVACPGPAAEPHRGGGRGAAGGGRSWAPPQVSAALYQAAARIPGVTVVPSATDAAGREGVAVARSAQGRETQWIFDRATHTFLGERTVLVEASDTGPAGTVLGSSAVLAKAAADRAGEAPKARTT
ncbi:hypothetical protein GCM10023205_68920 [Yinghuangia aomiensis]|uniref:RNA polymerase sigma-70 region 2 domain-containing protein n=1 Tax=Yinghuangia aomiensis TaxID=676205 RepID=A0ABP9I5J7_9ACTN